MANSLDFFRENVKQRIKKAGWKRAEFANKIGILPGKLSLYLSGRSEPRFEAIEAMAKGLSVEPWELFRNPKHDRARSEILGDTFQSLILSGADSETAARKLVELYVNLSQS